MDKRRRFCGGIALSCLFFIVVSAAADPQDAHRALRAVYNSVNISQEPWKSPSWADTIENIDYPSEPLTLPRGEELYYFFCLSCHGETGYGNGPAADTLKVKPANFNDRNFTSQSDGAIFWKLTTGRGSMPSFKEKFPEEMRWQTIAYIRKLAEYNAKANDVIK